VGLREGPIPRAAQPRGRGWSVRGTCLAVALLGGVEAFAEFDPGRRASEPGVRAPVEVAIGKVEYVDRRRSDVRLEYRNLSKHPLRVIEIRLCDRRSGSILTNAFSFKEVPEGGTGWLRFEASNLPEGLVFDSLRHELVVACAASHRDLCLE